MVEILKVISQYISIFIESTIRIFEVILYYIFPLSLFGKLFFWFIKVLFPSLFSKIDILLSSFLTFLLAYWGSIKFHNHKKREEIKEKHLKALEYIRIFLLNQIEIINLNLDIVNDFLEIINKYENPAISEKSCFSIAQLLEFDTNIPNMIDLLNIDFVNDLFINLSNTQRLNFVSKELMKYVYIYNNNLIQRGFENDDKEEIYKKYMIALKDDFNKKIKEELEKHLHNTENLMAKRKCRYIIDEKSKKKYLFITDYSIPKHYEKDFDKMVEKELEKLKQIKINLNEQQDKK